MSLPVFALTLLLLSASLVTIMAVAWFVQQRTGNSGWVDTIWTFGLGLIGAVSALAPLSGHPAMTGREIVVAVLVLAWAGRLGVHIGLRSASIADDPRYATLIREWGPTVAPRRMFWLLQKQALVTIPLAVSICLAAHNPAPLWRAQDVLAVLVLTCALAGEALADQQLRAFRMRPGNSDKVCDSGLWQYSRHPNYFFEWAGWLAYPLFAIEAAGDYPLGWIALAGPVCMYWLLVHVSGIPPLEAHMLQARGETYRLYQARTSAFFPQPPNKDAT